MLKHIIISYSLIVFYIVSSSNSVIRKDYGEFKTKILKFDICKGPKRIECSNVVAKVISDTNLILSINIKKNTVPTRGNIISTINNKTLVRLQMKTPCVNPIMKPLLRTAFNVTSACMFEQGNYSLDLNIDKMAQKHYGGMFLYGDLTFKSVLYNEECNLVCVFVNVLLYPK